MGVGNGGGLREGGWGGAGGGDLGDGVLGARGLVMGGLGGGGLGGGFPAQVKATAQGTSRELGQATDQFMKGELHVFANDQRWQHRQAGQVNLLGGQHIFIQMGSTVCTPQAACTTYVDNVACMCPCRPGPEAATCSQCAPCCLLFLPMLLRAHLLMLHALETCLCGGPRQRL